MFETNMPEDHVWGVDQVASEIGERETEIGSNA
jgi:hypothetical protein